MAEGEGTGEGTGAITGTGTGAGTGQQPQLFGDYRDQMAADLRANEAFTAHKTITDLGKAHIDVLGKVKELEGKTTQLEGSLKTAIPRLPENPTKEQINSFYSALGRPAKPEEYEFPKGEGVEHDDGMVNWARQTFYEIGLNKDQASRLAQKWDGFLQGMVQAEEEAITREIEEANKAFRAKFQSDEEHNAALELVSRIWKKSTNADFNEWLLKKGLGKDPELIQVILDFAKKTGEDVAPIGSRQRGEGEVRPGMIYDRTPQHQRK